MKGLAIVKVLRCYKKCLFLMEFLIVFWWYFSHNYLQLVYFQDKNYVHMWCPISSLKLLIDFGLNVSFKDTLKAFDDFKNKQKSVLSNVFWYVKLFIFWKCVQHNIHRDKTQIIKNSFGQNKRYKKFPLFSFASSNSLQVYF